MALNAKEKPCLPEGPRCQMNRWTGWTRHTWRTRWTGRTRRTRCRHQMALNAKEKPCLPDEPQMTYQPTRWTPDDEPTYKMNHQTTTDQPDELPDETPTNPMNQGRHRRTTRRRHQDAIRRRNSTTAMKKWTWMRKSLILSVSYHGTTTIWQFRILPLIDDLMTLHTPPYTP